MKRNKKGLIHKSVKKKTGKRKSNATKCKLTPNYKHYKMQRIQLGQNTKKTHKECDKMQKMKYNISHTIRLRVWSL